MLYYVLKKKPNTVEHDFINNLMDILIDQKVQFQSFFENQQQYGRYVDNEFVKCYANLLDIKELPDSTHDKSCIRLLGLKHQNTFPFDMDNDQSFFRRFFE